MCSATHQQTGVLFEDDPVELTLDNSRKSIPSEDHRLELLWTNIIAHIILHSAALYGLYLAFTQAKLLTNLWAIFLFEITALGLSAGVHRLWSHRAYKAKWPLRLILIIFNTIAFQMSVFKWARDHRVHHKYSETNADPHNSTRGFFFSHVGWLLCRKHPDVVAAGKKIDISDLEADPLVVFQKKYYFVVMPLLCFILPTWIPMYFWGESFRCSFFIPTIFRYTFTLHMTWLVNSAAHKWGNRPYNQYINPSENIVVQIGTLGEGSHNYHHTFPWDYKGSEWGSYLFNPTTAFIDFFVKLGWAYDLKSVSEKMIRKRIKRTGDGSHTVWGWGDSDLSSQDISDATVTNKKYFLSGNMENIRGNE